MAEIIAEPSALSKIIPVSFKINDTDSVTTTRLATKKQFNTTDTDAWLSFDLDGIETTGGEFDLTLINVDENPSSIFHHTSIAFSGIPFYYKLDAGEDLTKNEIRHAGRWIGQVIIRLANGDTTTRQFDFAIAGHLLDGKEARVILIEDYNALMATIAESKGTLDQYNIDYAALLTDITEAETLRTQNYNQLLADQQANIEAFDVALDEGIVAANLATKLQDFEATNNSRLLSAEQQLEQKANIADLPSSAYTFKGSTTFASLPTTGNVLGDVRYTTDNLQNYAWTGTAWTPIGNGAFANKSVTNAKLADGAVSPEKTGFVKRGDNILPTGSFVLGSLNYSTGVVTESTTEYATGLLPAAAYMNKYIYSANFVKATGYAADGVTVIANHTWSSIAIGQNRKVQNAAVEYIRFGITKANYDAFVGKIMIVATDAIITTMPDYEPFEYRIADLKVTSTDVDGLSDVMTDTFKSVKGEYVNAESIKDIARVNLLNKDDMTAGVLISTTTGAETVDATYSTSKPIDVRNHVGKHIISNVGSIRVAQYNKDGVFVTGGIGGITANRQIIHANTYTIQYSILTNTLNTHGYHEREYNGQYMTIWLGLDTEYTSDPIINGGEGFELYDERGRIVTTRQPKVLKNHILSSNANLVIYNAYNDLNANRRSVPRIYVDHILGLSDDKKITFGNGKDYLELPPTTIAGNSVQVVKTDKFKSDKYLLKHPKFNVRTIKSSIGASVVPRVLFIGDSITAGVPQMFDGIGLDTPYWGQVKRLFEMDKVDNGDVGYDIKILGGDTIPFNYNGVTRTLRGGKAAIGGYGLTNFMHHATNVQPSAESWILLGLDVSTGQPYTGTLAQKELIRMTPQYAYPNVGEGQCIPFYDENATGATTFSILRYLQRYRTMDDNGVRLTWGDPNIGSYIGSQEELDAWDVCTPTHIVLQHGRNDELYPNAFKDSLAQFISVVKAEIPTCKIGICIPPNNGGTIFPDRYPNITNVDKIGLSNSYFVGTSYDLAKIILDTHANREAESIYLIPNYFVQPTAYSIPLKKSDVMCSLETVYEQAIDEPLVSHPNGEAHKAWAYQVYCWLKYTMI